MAVVEAKIAAVSYLNTVPFIYGIRHAEGLRADILLAPPAECASNYLEHKADVALVPAGALHLLNDAEIVSGYCIGAERSVRTVVVMSNVPIDKVETIWLDSHSMTSALLTRILAEDLWHIKPEWKELTDYSLVGNAGPRDAFLLIGDKVFPHEGSFAYTWDLADCWRELTGKPFVFAVWVARKGTDPELLDLLEKALELGVERIWEAILESGHADKDYAYSYLTENIDFLLDYHKREALDIYREKARRFIQRSNPG